MKVAANVIAVTAWCGFIAAVCRPLFGGQMNQAYWIPAVVMTLLTGMIVPNYLMNLEARVVSSPGRVAANVMSIVAWCIFIILFVAPLLPGIGFQWSYWLASVLLMFIAGIFIPSHLLRLGMHARPRVNR